MIAEILLTESCWDLTANILQGDCYASSHFSRCPKGSEAQLFISTNPCREKANRNYPPYCSYWFLLLLSVMRIIVAVLIIQRTNGFLWYNDKDTLQHIFILFIYLFSMKCDSVMYPWSLDWAWQNIHRSIFQSNTLFMSDNSFSRSDSVQTSMYMSPSIDMENWIISLDESMVSLVFEARMTEVGLFQYWYCSECAREWKMEWKQAIFLYMCDASSLQHRKAAQL